MAGKHQFFLCIASLLLSSFCYGQPKDSSAIYKKASLTSEYEISPRLAHRKAQKILKDNFFWSTVDPSSPFGNDEGAEVFHGFRQWRATNKKTSPLTYLDQLIRSWDFPKFDVYELDTTRIKEYITSKNTTSAEVYNNTVLLEQFRHMVKTSGSDFSEDQFKELLTNSSESRGEYFLTAIDNAIIAVGFAQLVLEGTIEEDIRTITQIAIRRELLPLLIEKWGTDYQSIRMQQLNQMLTVLEKLKK
jgi:uncharacterized protein YfeS